MTKNFDIVVFGASGFTGKYVLENILKTLKTNPEVEESFTWAVAGRSLNKLENILQEVGKRTGHDLTNVNKIVADVSNQESLLSLARQARVIINCVGPYRFWGHAVVQACIEGGAHYVDVSGEPQFLEETQLNYHKLAESKGVYVVGSCALACIPSDCGTVFLMQNFGAHAHELRPLRSQLFPKSLPDPRYKISKRMPIHYSPVVQGWCVPSPDADKSVVKRSQYHLFHEEGQIRPVQIAAYIKQNSFLGVLGFALLGVIFMVLAKFQAGRYLLEKFPGFFSAGLVPKGREPKHEEMDKAITMTLVGKGWDTKLEKDSFDFHKYPPNTTRVVKIQGGNGYNCTGICVVQAALVILKEMDKMPSRGGVYPPGAAFSRTTLIQRLNKNGVAFTMGAKTKTFEKKFK